MQATTTRTRQYIARVTLTDGTMRLVTTTRASVHDALLFVEKKCDFSRMARVDVANVGVWTIDAYGYHRVA